MKIHGHLEEVAAREQARAEAGGKKPLQVVPS
jgi:hypothetical protein